jgi:hypothetical protein
MLTAIVSVLALVAASYILSTCIDVLLKSDEADRKR